MDTMPINADDEVIVIDIPDEIVVNINEWFLVEESKEELIEVSLKEMMYWMFQMRFIYEELVYSKQFLYPGQLIPNCCI